MVHELAIVANQIRLVITMFEHRTLVRCICGEVIMIRMMYPIDGSIFPSVVVE